MFEKILIPVSSEYLPKKAIMRALDFYKKFESEVMLQFIIEEKVLMTIDKASTYALCSYDREKIKEELVANFREGGIFKEVKALLKRKGVEFSHTTSVGEYSEEILKLNSLEDMDLLLMECHPYCLLKYRIFSVSPKPIWVERARRINTILAVLTNLAPNQRVPKYAVDLSNIYKAKLHFLYVIDSGSEKRRDERRKAQSFFERFAKENPNLSFGKKIKTGDLERVVEREENLLYPDLILIGRLKQKRRFLIYFHDNIKSALAKKSEHSVLLIN